MQTLELIRQVESMGGQFLIDGDRLGIRPAEVAQPILEDIKKLKLEIMDLLLQRPSMPAGVKLLRWEPKNAPVQLSPYEWAIDIDSFIRSTLRQVEARLIGKDWLAGNWTLSTLIDRLAAVGCQVALSNGKVTLQ